jgi:hypothetical protein
MTNRFHMRMIAIVAVGLVLGGPAAAGAARLDGIVVGLDGRPASGYRVHLIDAGGRAVAASAADDHGSYSFRDVAAGRYALGIETSAGAMAAVAAPPIDLAPGQLARRDVRLLQGDPAQVQATTNANYGLGTWWAGLSPAAKAWTIIGIVAVVGISAAALSDDDDEEPPASLF